jgi:hypothetical protein
MVAQPAAPAPVIRPTAGHELPELRPVSEHAEVRQLVDDHGFERLRRSEYQPPREGEAARARATSPPRARVSNRDRGRLHRQGGGVALYLSLDRRTRPHSQPGLQDRGQVAPLPAPQRTTSSSPSSPPSRVTTVRRRSGSAPLPAAGAAPRETGACHRRGEDRARSAQLSGGPVVRGAVEARPRARPRTIRPAAPLRPCCAPPEKGR